MGFTKYLKGVVTPLYYYQGTPLTAEWGGHYEGTEMFLKIEEEEYNHNFADREIVAFDKGQIWCQTIDFPKKGNSTYEDIHNMRMMEKRQKWFCTCKGLQNK